ncbi:MAG: hypothetical protein N2484_06040 [Clostridia bacterium]|nr:hypothetical protein [Clostridia bacterium]
MSKKPHELSTFRIAATYIGTVIGAGFASGQEILQFFGVFGNWGLLGLLLVTLFFVIYGYIIMDLGYRIGSPSYIEIIRLSGGKYFGIIADSIISFFLFGSTAAMIAASGALFKQQFGIQSTLGGLIMTIITVATVFMGINGIVNSLSVIVPFLLISAVGISIFSVAAFPSDHTNIQAASSTGTLVGNWFSSAMLYVSYNIVTAIAVLGPLGKRAKNGKAVRNGAAVGGITLGICALAIYLAIANNLQQLMNAELPMVSIASRISPVIQIVYALVLLAGIFATSAGSLYGFSARVFDIDGPKGKFMIFVVAILAFVAGQFGFSNLVKYMYPIEGYLGMILLASLLYSRIRITRRRQA